MKKLKLKNILWKNCFSGVLKMTSNDTQPRRPLFQEIYIFGKFNNVIQRAYVGISDTRNLLVAIPQKKKKSNKENKSNLPELLIFTQAFANLHGERRQGL